MTTLHHRARSLILMGLVWIAVGTSVLVDPPGLPGHAYVLEALPTGVRAAIWLVAGGSAVVAAQRRRWTRWGFVALVIPAALRTFSYAWAGIVWILSGGTESAGAAWLEAGTWAVVTLFVIHEATAVDAPKTKAAQ